MKSSQPKPQPTKTPAPPAPVVSQPHVGVDADVERVIQLQRSAEKLLGKDKSSGV